eukprot:350708-Chlamydomonas_euryale.AAC.8
MRSSQLHMPDLASAAGDSYPHTPDPVPTLSPRRAALKRSQRRRPSPDYAACGCDARVSNRRESGSPGGQLLGRGQGLG